MLQKDSGQQHDQIGQYEGSRFKGSEIKGNIEYPLSPEGLSTGLKLFIIRRAEKKMEKTRHKRLVLTLIQIF
jgi:hypothetical protein